MKQGEVPLRWPPRSRPTCKTGAEGRGHVWPGL